MILRAAVGGMEQRGVQPSEDVTFAAGQEVLAELVELAVAIKLVPEEQEEKLFHDSAFEAVKAYGEAEQESGEITPEARQEAQQFMQQQMQAEQQSQPQAQSQQGIVQGAM